MERTGGSSLYRRQAYKKLKGMWVDFRSDSDKEGWWPDLKVWKIGLWMENVTLDLDEPEVL